MVLKGGKIKIDLVKRLIMASYGKTKSNTVDGYVRDTSISRAHTIVFVDEANKHVVVVHRPTDNLYDVASDVFMSVGLFTPRFKEAKTVQDKALKKYKGYRISVIGYSLGASVAEKVSKDSTKDIHEIILMSKPVTPHDVLIGQKANEKTTEIRSTADPVSVLKPLQTQDREKQVIVPNKTMNMLKEHNVKEVLERLDPDMEVGEGSGVIAYQSLMKMNNKQLKEFIKRNRPYATTNHKYLVTGKKRNELREMAKHLFANMN